MGGSLICLCEGACKGWVPDENSPLTMFTLHAIFFDRRCCQGCGNVPGLQSVLLWRARHSCAGSLAQERRFAYFLQDTIAYRS
jgi:hypothetical protein